MLLPGGALYGGDNLPYYAKLGKRTKTIDNALQRVKRKVQKIRESQEASNNM